MEQVNTLDQLSPKLSYKERDFDLLFIEEICFGKGFFEAFAEKIDFRVRPIKAVRHSVFENFGGDAWGETDIVIDLVDGAALFIENKLSADFQAGQAMRYRARADYYRRSGFEIQTILMAPEIYLSAVSKFEWDRLCSYAQISDCILVEGPRSLWRRSLFREAGNRAARVQRLAVDASARRAASQELLAFKSAWRDFIVLTSEWKANPQTGATDEFLYAPRLNPFGLRIWHHPFAGYLSVQNLEKFAGLDEALSHETLPEGFRVTRHPRSTYLDATVPEIDMATDFTEERERVEEGMRIARQALDLVETAIRKLPSID